MAPLFGVSAMATVVLFSLAFAAPVSDITSSDPAIKLEPFSASSFDSSFDLPMEPRAEELLTSSAPVIILSPITKAQLSGSLDLPLRRRAASAIAMIPQNNITLYHQSSDTTIIQAVVNTTMKNPSILLEDIDSITKVDCSATSVDVTFNNQADYDQSSKSWPASSFMLFTNHLGDCDAENERGFYDVSSLSYNAATLTITASTTASNFNSSAAEMSLAFAEDHVSDVAKRGKPSKPQTFMGVFPELLTLSTGPVQDSLSVTIAKPRLGGSINVRGHLNYDFLHPKKSKFYVDVDLELYALALVKVSAGVKYTDKASKLHTYTPESITVSAFSIPHILDIGPMVEF